MRYHRFGRGHDPAHQTRTQRYSREQICRQPSYAISLSEFGACVACAKDSVGLARTQPAGFERNVRTCGRGIVFHRCARLIIGLRQQSLRRRQISTALLVAGARLSFGSHGRECGFSHSNIRGTSFIYNTVLRHTRHPLSRLWQARSMSPTMRRPRCCP